MKYSKLTQFQICMVIFLLAGFFSCKQKGSPPVAGEDMENTVEETVFAPDTLKLLFVGDVITHSTVYNSAKQEGGDSTYNFNPMFQFIKDYISSADLSLANLEVPLGGMPYSGYPLFSAPPEIADALKDAGFDILLTANNHVADRGRKGIEDTIDYLDKLGFRHAGSYKDSIAKAADYPLQVEMKGIRLSILSYTYDTNGMPVYKPNLVNRIDTVRILSDIRKSKQQNPDFIIACMHWGYEYQNKEHEEQRELARFLARNGIDLIVGGHPHVIQPFDTVITEEGQQTPVIYSIGNFLSNQQWRYADGGIAFEVTLVKTEEGTSLHSVAYEPFWVNRDTHPAKGTIYRIIPVNDYDHSPARYDLNADQIFRLKQFREDTRKILHNLEYGEYYRN